METLGLTYLTSTYNNTLNNNITPHTCTLAYIILIPKHKKVPVSHVNVFVDPKSQNEYSSFSFIWRVFTPPVSGEVVDAEEVKKSVTETVTETVVGDCKSTEQLSMTRR